jgi:hypothetical protein
MAYDNMWEVLPIKMYPILKTFVHEAYTRRLMSIQLCNMAGQQGYVQNPNNNMYNVFGEGDDKVADGNTTITQTAMAVMTGSTSEGATKAATSNATIPSEVSAAINQLAANQTAMMNQMAAMQFSPPPPCTPHWPRTNPCPTYPTVEYPSATGIRGRIFSTRTRGRKRTRW